MNSPLPTLTASVTLLALFAGCSDRARSVDALRSNEADRDGTASADTLRVLAYNIHHGEGMDGRLDLERIAALIREVDPDLVTLQEVDSVTSRTNAIDQAAELGRLTGLKPVFGRFMSYQGGAYGMALLSKWEISE